MEIILYPLLGGIGLALILPVLGCLMIWNRMTYLSDSLSHSAILGIAIALALDIHYIFGLAIICVIFMATLFLHDHERYPPEVLFGYLSSVCLALALIIAFVNNTPQHLENYLFGDILLITQTDLYIIFALVFIISIWLFRNWQALLLSAVSPDLAEVESINVRSLRACFILFLGAVIAISLKITGALLISAMLIIPAISVRSLSKSPEQMILLAVFSAAFSIIAGLVVSYNYDIPSGPSIILISSILFILSNIKTRQILKTLYNRDKF